MKREYIVIAENEEGNRQIRRSFESLPEAKTFVLEDFRGLWAERENGSFCPFYYKICDVVTVVTTDDISTEEES